MLLGLIILGVGLLVVAMKNTQHELGAQLARDVLGPNGFVAWAAAIVVIGGLGFVPGLETPSHYLLALLAVVMLLRNKGVFDNAVTALAGASKAGPAPAVQSPPVGGKDSAASGGSGGGGNPLQTVASVATIAALFA